MKEDGDEGRVLGCSCIQTDWKDTKNLIQGV